ncbi:FAD-dependent oxidoreductase [Acrocarpospora pleiomorpha]|uniref:FAD-dependent oxidoreductase n=1 Tax=Acrocarpospora pleiomorpha TaxID=90975 RepID=A0A5M3XYV0_9ACTN|nr:glycerol-3-phosphate dehydrogenase/oxidase [Acrocarpospora pleiomorpha]GES26086.1 FAD-dependent oxidoreductase [Acrocarpospora pleiomorpha]
MNSRELSLRSQYDLVVVGGGCNGLAIAWDAALRGVPVLLLEKHDFGWATSAWNSRLIHGGLKYLERGDVALVRDSLREREWLLRAAPHLIEPLRFCLPLYRDATHRPWLLRAAMLAYDVLSFDKSTAWHRQYSTGSFVRLLPSLNRTGLRGGVAYFEAQVAEPERLMTELAAAARAAGAHIVNHAEVDGATWSGEGITGVRFTDTTSGRRYGVTTRLVVNAAGPWVDDVLTAMHSSKPVPLMGGTKGTHLVVGRFPGAPSDAVYYEARSDSRALFVIPWRGRYLLGSTDDRFSGEPGAVSPTAGEIDYILAETNILIPEARLGRDDVVWCYAGVRPLPYSADGPTGDITRRHIVKTHDGPLRGVLSVIGGKLTTFRSVGEDVVDRVLKLLDRKVTRTPTRTARLPGAEHPDRNAWIAGYLERSALPPEVAARLVASYGIRAQAVEDIAARNPRLAEVLRGTRATTAAEVVFAVEESQAVTLEDIIARRIMTGLDDDLGLASLAEVAEVVTRFCGWAVDRVETDMAHYRHYIKKLQPRYSGTP